LNDQAYDNLSGKKTDDKYKHLSNIATVTVGTLLVYEYYEVTHRLTYLPWVTGISKRLC